MAEFRFTLRPLGLESLLWTAGHSLLSLFPESPEHPVLTEPPHLSSILPGMLAPRPGQLPLARDYGPWWFPESRLDIPAVSVSLSPSRHFSTCSCLVSPPPRGLSKGGSCAAACPLLLTAPAKRLEYSRKDASIPVKTKQLMAFNGPLCNRLLQI